MTDRALLQQALDALADVYSGLRYIRTTYGDLPNVGWNRASQGAEAAIDALRARLAKEEK